VQSSVAENFDQFWKNFSLTGGMAERGKEKTGWGGSLYKQLEPRKKKWTQRQAIFGIRRKT